MTPENKIQTYRDVLRTFRAASAPGVVGSAVQELRKLAMSQNSCLTLDIAVKKRAEDLGSQKTPLSQALDKTLLSTHELVKFVADEPEGRASNRILNSLDRANAVRFFGPVRNESKSFKQAAVEQVAADAASLAPVQPAVLAGKIKLQQKTLRAIDAKIKAEKVSARRAKLEALRKQQLKQAAALVTAAKVKELQDARRFKPFDIKKVEPNEAKARVQTILRKIAALNREITKLTARIASMTPGVQRAVLFNRRAKLAAEKSGLERRLKLLRQGRDKVQVRRVRVQKQRPQIRLTPGVVFRPAPDLVTVLVRYLAQRIPRRPGESRRHFLLRLRIYVQRALARYAANAASEPDPNAAAEAAAVATVTEDAPAIEAEVDAGGVAEDDASDAMTEVAEEFIPQMEQAAADFAPETAENSDPDEFVTSDTALVDSSPETIDSDLEDAFETLDVSTGYDDDDDDEDSDSEARPWFKNPVVWGGAALAAVLILRR